MNWRAVYLLILGGMLGCQAPPAPVAGCDCGPAGQGRNAILARQIAADTAVSVVQHPIERSEIAVYQSADGLLAASQGLIGKRLLMHLHGRPGPVAMCRPMTDCQYLEARLTAATGQLLQPADLQLYTEGQTALAALLKMIDEATCRLDVIMFMWDDSPLGLSIAQHLAAKASPQLPVRVLVDGGGNLLFAKPDTAPAAVVNGTVCWLSQQPYVQVIRIRNPCTHFDHRKLVIADGQVAWTGGRNFTEEGFFQRHDVSLTLTGPLVADMSAIFEYFWRDQGGPPLDALPASPPVMGNAEARVVYTEPGDHQFEKTVYAAVDSACHHVYVENPYLTDSGLVIKLARARRRGADVRVILSITTDTPETNHAIRVVANRLLRAGVRVYLYPGLTHVKAAAVDGCWAYLGTGNFDARSLRFNREIGLSISASPVIEEIENRVFLPDFRPEWELRSPLHLTPKDYYYELLGSLFL